MKLGKSVSSTKNSIIEYFKRKGLFDELPEINDIFSVKKRNAMKKIEFGNQKDLVLSTIIERLEFYKKQVIPLESEIRKIARDSEDIKLLMTIPGIDYYLASLISFNIGNVDRFENSDKLASFFWIITSTKDSSPMTPYSCPGSCNISQRIQIQPKVHSGFRPLCHNQGVVRMTYHLRR